MTLAGMYLVLGFLICKSSLAQQLFQANLGFTVSGWHNTALPSDLPSITPTESPSDYLQSIQGYPLPTHFPTISPPSDYPSTTPSSPMPSTAPSPDCHDVSSYRSPLNNFQCSDHAGTDCFQWRFLGLEADQVEGLVMNCPVTCNIECGTLYSFEVQFQFRLGNVDNFLAPESTRIFQEASADYLTRFVQPKAFDNRFVVHGVELLRQRLPEGAGRHVRRILQKYLAVSVVFRGFAVGLNYAIVEALLLEGIESNGYAGAIQLAGDPSLRRARISFDIDVDDANAPVLLPDIPTRPESFTWVFVAIMIVAVMVLGAIVFQYVRHRRAVKNRAVVSDSNEDFPMEIGEVSPIALSDGHLSFDGVLHVVSSFSPKSECEEVQQDSFLASKSGSHTSETTPEFTPVPEKEHPLTGIIPQMIVYKGIDDHEDEASETSQVWRVFPSKRVIAQPDFLEALHQHQHSDLFVDYSVYDGILRYCSSADDGSNLMVRSLSEESYFSSDENADPKDMNQKHVTESDGTEEVHLERPSKERMRSPLRNVMHSKALPPSSPFVMIAKPPPRPVTRTHTTGSLDDCISVASNARGFDGHNSQGSLVQTIMSMSPRKLLKPLSNAGPSSHSTLESKLLFSRKRTKSSCSESSGEAARFIEDGEHHVFQAPRKGKLGLVIQCIDQNGPLVAHVKDYSPLLGQVLRGDRILELDNRSTIGMKVQDVTAILGGRVTHSNRWVSVLRIAVRRPASIEKTELLKLLDETPEPMAPILSRTPPHFVDARSRTPATPAYEKVTPPRHPLLRSASEPMTQTQQRFFERKD